MKAKSLRIIMNGVTGRMGTNQHLVRSILAIREQGGTLLADGRRVMPEPVLVGRDRDKLEALARSHGLSRYTTNLDEALDDAANEVYFDAQTTAARADGIRRAVDAGKAIYCEKPTAVDTGTALDLFRRCTGHHRLDQALSDREVRELLARHIAECNKAKKPDHK